MNTKVKNIRKTGRVTQTAGGVDNDENSDKGSYYRVSTPKGGNKRHLD